MQKRRGWIGNAVLAIPWPIASVSESRIGTLAVDRGVAGRPAGRPAGRTYVRTYARFPLTRY